MKNNKGITLIALIITIIVMLILVGVTVSVVINSNLIGTAQGAGENTKLAYGEEANMSKVTIDEKTYASIEHFINGYIEVSENPTHILYLHDVALLIDEETRWTDCTKKSNGIIQARVIDSDGQRWIEFCVNGTWGAFVWGSLESGEVWGPDGYADLDLSVVGQMRDEDYVLEDIFNRTLYRAELVPYDG